MITDVALGKDVVLYHPELINLYECSIGPETRIGTFVEIQRGAAIGARCKISSHCFICEGVTIEDGVFLGHGVMFTNDRYPRAVATDGQLQSANDWTLEPTLVRRGPPSAAMPPSCRVSRSENMPLSALVQWSPATCRIAPSSSACRRE